MNSLTHYLTFAAVFSATAYSARLRDSHPGATGLAQARTEGLFDKFKSWGNDLVDAGQDLGKAIDKHVIDPLEDVVESISKSDELEWILDAGESVIYSK